MKRKKEYPYYVIAKSPLDHSGYGGRGLYYGDQGQIVENKSAAAIFSTYGEAEEFANQHGIQLGDAVPYIARIWYRQDEIDSHWRLREAVDKVPKG